MNKQEHNEPIELHTGNPEVDAYIEENDMKPIAEDLYECAGGHVWHIDDIERTIKNDN